MDNTLQKLSSQLHSVETSLELLADRSNSITRQIEATNKELITLGEVIAKNEEGHALISKGVQIVYASLSSRLGDIITEGIHCVFPDSPYTKFVIEFVPRRDSIEADLYLIDKDGEKYNPMTAVGGGVSDLIALLLRITYVKLSPYKDFILADEPLKFVDKSRIEDAANFIHKICNDIDFMLVTITHIPEFVKVSDAIYRVLRKNGVTSVTQLTHEG